MIYILCAFITSSLLTYFLSRQSVEFFQDTPNQRSLHSVPTPRSGGIAIVIGMGLSTLAIFVSVDNDFILPTNYLIGCLLIAIVSFMDDLFHLSPLTRLLFQSLAALLVVFSSSLYSPGNITAIGGMVLLLVVLAVVWSINLYNFMDGMDGFAGGMSVIGFSTLAIIGYLSGADGYGIFCAMIASAAAGFLIWNFPPARIFMGDLGSTTLGYLMAVMSIYGVVEKIFPWWCPVIIFAPFWLDASLTLLKRILAGKRFWEAHREHYYQRLVLAKHTHRQVVLWEYALMILSAVSVVFGYLSEILLEGALVPIAWLFVYIALLVCLECHLRRLSV